MTNKWGIPSRVLRNATRYDIPDPVVRHVARRDKSCVYCDGTGTDGTFFPCGFV
jgi:hypothetical protein